MSDEREAYGKGKHPPYCTCSDCSARRRGVPPAKRPSSEFGKGWAICRYCLNSGRDLHVSDAPIVDPPYTACPWCRGPLQATVHANGHDGQAPVYSVVCAHHGVIAPRARLDNALRLARDPSCEKLTLAERAERERHRRPPESAKEPRRSKPLEEPAELSPNPPKPAEEPGEAPSSPPKPAGEPGEAPSSPPKPAEEPGEAPPSPPKPAEEPAEAPPSPPKPAGEPGEAPSSPPKPAEEPGEAPSDPPESADRPSAAPPTPPKQPPKGPREAPPRPPPEKPARPPAASPKPPKSGCASRAAILLLVLVAAIGAVAYFGGFLDLKEDLPPEVIVMTPTPAPDPTPTPVIVPATPTPTPAPTALPTSTATPAGPTPTPTVSPLEVWQAAEKAVTQALEAYESVEGEERTEAFAAVEAAQAAEAHAFAVLHGLPTPTPGPPTATPTPGPPTATPTPRPTATPTPRPTATPTPRPTATPTPRPTSTPTPRPTATPTPRPTSTPTPRPTATPAPTLRYKEYMLEFINEARAEAGVPAVILGDNRAPQIQAESSLANCFSGHWGLDGLKPYMRYSLAGGYQSNGENALGFYSCPSNVRALPNIEQVVREAMDSWMESPGHRRNILDPWHRKVSIGFAWNRHYYAAYQHFEGDYVEYDRLPTIDANGVLSLSGIVKNGARLRGREGLSVQVYYDPPPGELTRGQISRTYCYEYGVRVASLRYPLSGNSYWTEDAHVDADARACPDPYDIPLTASPPTSFAEQSRFHLEAVRESLLAQNTSITVPWITARTWNVTADSFSVTVDLGDVIDEHGPGVYSIIVWGTIGGERVVISEYSMFYQVTPPDTYSAAG